jgi:Sulfotransferase family
MRLSQRRFKFKSTEEPKETTTFEKAKSNETTLLNGHTYISHSEPNSLIYQLSHHFPIWNRSTTPYAWCHARHENNSGLLFVKIDKCASTTGMGVTLRVADTLARRLLGDGSLTTHKPCFARYLHGYASTGDRDYLHRREDQSFLWSIVRHPASRVLSAYFFFEVSRLNRTATENSILQYVSQPSWKTHLVEYLRLKEFTTRKKEIVHIFQNYDFLAVSERMEESIVVLSLLMQVPIADVIVLSSKESGGYDDGLSKNGCVKIRKKWSTPKIDDYMQRQFLNHNFDYLLYQIANASLDKTIHALGRDKVDAGIQLYRTLQSKNENICFQKAIFPCPKVLPNHTYLSRRDCYSQDSGCGHKCTDTALQSESLQQWQAITLGSL